MSVNIKRKDKEPTKMEKRDTSIMNFILVALAPLALVLFLGFSWGNSNTINSENLFAEVKKMKKDKKRKDRELDILTNLFTSSIDTLVQEFEEQYASSKNKVRGSDDIEDWEDWQSKQNKKVKQLRSKIEGNLAEYDFKNMKLKVFSEMGLERLISNYESAFRDEINGRSTIGILRLEQDMDIDCEKAKEDIEENLDDMESKVEKLEDKLERCKESGENRFQDKEIDCSRVEKDLEEKEEEFEKYEEKIQKKGEDIKDKIEEEAEEIQKLLEELKAARPKDLVKDRNKMERLRSKLQSHLTKIEAQADKLGDF